MTTETEMDTATISSKSRNLGYAWSNSFQSRPNGWEPFPLTEPTVEGGLRAVETERARAHRVNSGGQEWYSALFVGGRRVTGVWGWVVDYPEYETRGDEETLSGSELTLHMYPDDAPARETWLCVDIGSILHDLREGETLRVRLA